MVSSLDATLGPRRGHEPGRLHAALVQGLHKRLCVAWEGICMECLCFGGAMMNSTRCHNKRSDLHVNMPWRSPGSKNVHPWL
jgi:hypothetical protein